MVLHDAICIFPNKLEPYKSINRCHCYLALTPSASAADVDGVSAGNEMGIRQAAARQAATLSGFSLFVSRLLYKSTNHSLNTDYCLVNHLGNHCRDGDGRILVVRA